MIGLRKGLAEGPVVLVSVLLTVIGTAVLPAPFAGAALADYLAAAALLVLGVGRRHQRLGRAHARFCFCFDRVAGNQAPQQREDQTGDEAHEQPGQGSGEIQAEIVRKHAINSWTEAGGRSIVWTGHAETLVLD